MFDKISPSRASSRSPAPGGHSFEIPALPRSGREVCAVVTTFRPDNQFPVRMERLRPQVGLVIVVDDGAIPENACRLGGWFTGRRDVQVVHHRQNAGQAAALNTGIVLAQKNSFRWFITLDDDTLVRSDMVERLLANLLQLPAGRTVALAGMSWSESRAAAPPTGNVYGSSWVVKRGIITSGSFFSDFMYDAVGPFKEEYIIDGIDYEYCMRARMKGYRIVKFMEIGFEQSLGKLKVRHLGPFAIKTYNYVPARCYYKFRNNIMNLRMYGFRDPLYAGAVIIGLIRTFLIVGLFESNKSNKVRFMIRGLWHGVNRKMGKTVSMDAGL